MSQMSEEQILREYQRLHDRMTAELEHTPWWHFSRRRKTAEAIEKYARLLAAQRQQMRDNDDMI